MTADHRFPLSPSRRAVLTLGAATLVAGSGRSLAEPSTIELPPARSEITLLPSLPVVRPQHVPRDDGMLFFAQNSINDNVLVYAIRTTESGALDPDEPMTVFWRRYSDQGQRRELNFFERTFALGLSITTEAPGRWSARMVGWREREVVLDLGPDGRPRATIDIDRRPMRPLYAYAEAYGSRFIPTIRHVDLYARADGEKGVVRERIFFE